MGRKEGGGARGAPLGRAIGRLSARGEPRNWRFNGRLGAAGGDLYGRRYGWQRFDDCSAVSLAGDLAKTATRRSKTILWLHGG